MQWRESMLVWEMLYSTPNQNNFKQYFGNIMNRTNCNKVFSNIYIHQNFDLYLLVLSFSFECIRISLKFIKKVGKNDSFNVYTRTK
jgi:hypothetical protein